MKAVLTLSALLLLASCGRGPPAPTPEQAARLNEAEAMLNDAAQKEGPADRSAGPANRSD